MFARASRLKLKQNARQQLHISPNDLHLPWLCPVLYEEQQLRRSSSTTTPPHATITRSRPAVTELKRSSPLARGLASATAFDYAPSIDEYIPFESEAGRHAPQAFQLPWMATAKDVTFDHLNTNTPIIIKDSLSTKTPRFRSIDAISGELHDIMSTLKACLHVGRFERAATLMQRLNSLYKPDAPALLAAHKDYIREYAWKILSTRDQKLLSNLQKWFEVELRGRGVVPDVDTYAFMIQAVLQDVSITRSNRSIRRYLHLAEKAGLRNELMNALLAVLNEQDFGRVTRISTPEPTSTASILTPEQDVTLLTAPPSKRPSPELPEVRPVDRNLTGWRALKQSLSVFSDPSDVLASEHLEATEEDKVKRSDVERQLRMEQDTYESALGKWRSESEQLKRLGINSALTHSSFGAMMWGWHEALEPAVREEIKLANEAECKAVKTPADEERCQYGPFLQYLDPAKLSAITILTTMTALGTSTEGERGYPVSRLVIKIGDAVQDESIAGYLKTHRARPGSLQGAPQPSGIRPLAIGMKRRVKSLKNTTDASPDISAQALEGYQWSPTVKAHIGAVLLSKLIDDAKCRVFGKHPENGSILESSQRAFLHRFRYSSGRRIGMLSLNSSMYDHLAKEPVASSLAQKHLPMVVEPKSWAGFREGGFLTSTTPLVRMLHGYDQSRKYIAIAVDNGDMAQVCAGLDILSRTPWQINGPVFEVMLEAWNSGEAIGGIAPENPDIQLPPEPPAEDRAARCQWLKEVRRLGNEKAGHRSERCFQNFQLEIARAYLNETFYFPHNVDFRGRAYPMPPFLNHMGNDLCRGLLTFGVGKQLGEDGLRWLKIHLANIFGYDKASFEDRVKFVEGHLADILDSADRPLQGQRWWLGADDPWQCLAACKELKNALHSPDPHAFVSQLAIHQDGTCNGLQHYAALGGDAIGARQVNLEPGDKPSDVYTGVAELVQRDIAEEARQGQELAQHLDGKISRKVVKQTVMTNVYGVTFMGARLQVLRQLRDLYPNFPESQAVNYHKAAFYIAGKIFRALANMFNGAHDIQYWLGDCASRIATAVTPEQMQRIESAMAGTLNEPEDFQKKSLKRKGERGYKDELLSFKQSVIWTTPLKMPVVQPYRHKTMEIIPTHLQRISLHNPSLADPVNKRKQLQAFPPNFIHSLDATHMVLSALQCEKQGLTFAAVHDSFWTHASDVSTMNRILRDAFITMHSEDIVGRLRSEFDIRYKGCLYMTQVKEKSPIGRKILDWRGKNGARHPRKKELEAAQIKELLLERRRLKLLASEKPEERQEGEAMVTPCSLFEQSDGEADLAVDESIADASLGNVSTRRENKLQLNEELMVGDEENIDVPDRTLDDPDERAEADVESAPAEATSSVDLTPKKRPTRQLKTWLWRPLTFPPVPKKGEFDVSRIVKSKYFFS